VTRVLDLGMQPIDDSLVDPERLDRPDLMERLQLFVCTDCWLLQSARRAYAGRSGKDHGHGAAQSSTMRDHLKALASDVVRRLGLGRSSLALDVSCGDGSLLRALGDHGVRLLGLEPDGAVAATAAAAGVSVMRESFGLPVAQALTKKGIQPDVVLVNHALAHVEDLGATLASIETVLAPGGTVVVEFHHALQVMQGQFDVGCHAHSSYFSLISLERALHGHGLTVVDATSVDTYGGSVLALVKRSGDVSRVEPSVHDIEQVERLSGLGTLDGYAGLQDRARQVSEALIDFLRRAEAAAELVVGYGASSRGTTLFCFCGIGTSLIPFAVDRAPAKQGRFLPGSRIPVLGPEIIESERADHILILPWPLADEIMAQIRVVRTWGGDFLVALPDLTRFA
jgi:C-methyltransferase C-terminal domain/Methyltransferase domain/Putative zinc binding domain